MRHWSSSPAIRTQAADQKPTPGRAGSTSSTAWTARIRPWPCAIELPGVPGRNACLDADAAAAALVHQLSGAQWDAATDGWPFEVSVRRDHVRLIRAASPSDAAGVNAVAGRVSAIEYQGTWLKITIEEACSEEFVANVPDHVFFADPLKVGDAVLAQWDAKEVHYLDGYSGARAASSPAAAAASVASA